MNLGMNPEPSSRIEPLERLWSRSMQLNRGGNHAALL